MYENDIICKRCGWNDYDLSYASRNIFNKCENCEYRTCLCLMLIFINVPYHDQKQSSSLGYHTKLISKENLNRIILLKYEICLNQVYICDAFFYIIRMQTLFLKKCSSREMKASFLSQCNQYLYYHMFDQTLFQWNRQTNRSYVKHNNSINL